MASGTQQLPSHYDVLGLSTTASQDDIAHAFARAMSIFAARPVAAIARISRAFEVLRNPEKRRLYDRSIGVAIKPQPYQWQVAIAPLNHRPLIAAAQTSSPRSPAKPGRDARPQIAEKQNAAVLDVHAAETALPAFIKSLDALAEPTFERRSLASAPSPEVQSQPQQVAAGCGKPPFEHVPTISGVEEVLLRHSEHQSEWKRPLLVLGGLILGASLIGAFAGLSIPTDQQSVVTARVPQSIAKLRAEASPSTRAAAPFTDEIQARDVTRFPHRGPDLQPKRASSRRRLVYDGTSDALPSAATNAVDLAKTNVIDPLPPGSDSAVQLDGKLPLPRSVIVRTIERIGYACGSISSSAPVAASPGTFQVTCRSGNSYRAAPVGGRYHFRMLRGRQVNLGD